MAAIRYEDMDSRYPTHSSSDSLNGLKFGQKIYFGDVGLAVSGSSSSNSSSGSGGAVTPAKKGRGMVQPPRCQVEGCNVDLSDVKAYYSRHKVCCMHSKSSKVVVGGIEQRFCQQCSRFHLLAEFDHGKRSCRRRLADHNERRRKPPPGSLLSSRLGRLSHSVFGGGSNMGGFLVDFASNLKAPGQSVWPETRTSASDATDVGKFLQSAWPGSHPSPGQAEMLLQTTAGGANYQVGPTTPSGECFAGVSDSSCALSLLSNQQWSSGNRAPCNLLNTGGEASRHLGYSSWGFKAAGEASHGPTSHLGLGQVSQTLPSRFGEYELDMGQSGGRQLEEYEHSRSYGSATDHMQWLL